MLCDLGTLEEVVDREGLRVVRVEVVVVGFSFQQCAFRSVEFLQGDNHVGVSYSNEI